MIFTWSLYPLAKRLPSPYTGGMHCRRSPVSRVLILAAALLALGPALAPVLSASPHKFIEICTAFGAVKMAVAGETDPADDNGEGHALSNHCVFCQSRQAVLLPPPQPLLPLPAQYALVQPVFPDAPVHDQAGFPLYDPTGPPVFS